MNFIKKLFAYNCISCGTATQGKSSVLCERCANITDLEFTKGNTKSILWCLPYKSKIPQDLVLYMKDNNDESAFALAAQFIHRRLQLENIQDIEEYYITFAPRKPISKLMRKFDQSHKIGEALSEILFNDRNYCISAIKRSYFSKSQKLLNQEERKKNLSKKLKLKGYYKRHSLPKKLIVIDDVTTTGTTLEKIHELLLDAGVESCILVALCGVNFGK